MELRKPACVNGRTDTGRFNYWWHGEDRRSAGQFSRPVSSALKRPLWSDGSTNRGLLHKRGCVCMFIFDVHRYAVHCLRFINPVMRALGSV